MRWILTVVAVVGLVGAWFTHSGTAFGLMLLVGILAALAAAFAFAQARIDGNAQPELIADPEVEALRARLRARPSGKDA